MVSLAVKGKARTMVSRAARTRIRRRALRILDASGSTDAELSVVLTDDGQVRELNRTYRSQDQTTDVLSFALDAEREPDDGAPAPAAPHGCPELPRMLGDVVISVEQAQRQALDGDLVDELTRLLVHGVCHLQGQVHDTAPQRQQMQQAEQRLLDLFGLDRGLTARADAAQAAAESRS